MSFNKLRFGIFSLLWFSLISCGDPGPGDGPHDFDQGPFLEKVGERILNAYTDLATQSSKLQSDLDVFVDNPSDSMLQVARQSLKEARLSWQACTPFQFGPAESAALMANLNIYPTDEQQIEQNIANGDYNLGSLGNADAKGFPAIAYLLFASGHSDEAIIEAFNDPNRGQYLLDVASIIETQAETVRATWANSYKAEFTAKDAHGVDVGSSMGILVNTLSQDFERNCRDGKIGIPVGVRSLGIPIPENCEAFYGGYSVELLERNVQAYNEIFEEAFYDYLDGIEAVTESDDQLAEAIDAQFVVLETSIDGLTDPLPEQIASDQELVEMVFTEMQKLVILFKTEMASEIGVVITYQDNDGD